MGTHGEQLCGHDIGYSIGRSLHSLRSVGMTVLLTGMTMMPVGVTMDNKTKNH